jgi:hypothetical protein
MSFEKSLRVYIKRCIFLLKNLRIVTQMNLLMLILKICLVISWVGGFLSLVIFFGTLCGFF